MADALPSRTVRFTGGQGGGVIGGGNDDGARARIGQRGACGLMYLRIPPGGPMSQNQQLSASNMILDVLDALDLVLADMFALYVKTKNSHWHVSGPHFRDYHLLLDDQASQNFCDDGRNCRMGTQAWPADTKVDWPDRRSPATLPQQVCSRTGSTGPTVVSGSCSRPCKWASAVGLAMTRLMIDGREVEVPPGSTILQACEHAGIEVPRLLPRAPVNPRQLPDVSCRAR